jgi:putative Mg2+ transporter-C (MgtC) family protein
MKEGMNVRGLNTAATLWASAAVGSCAGADMLAQSAALTVFVLAGNTMLRPLVNAIDRIPLSVESSEATYELSVVTDARRAAEVREVMNERLDAASYPVRETRSSFTRTTMSRSPPCWCRSRSSPAISMPWSASCRKLPGVSHATWSVSALE